MFIRTIIIMFVIFGVSLIAVPESAQIRGAVTAAPKKITCSKCGQKYNEGTRHVCPQSPQPQQKTAVCDLCKKQYTYKNDVHFVLGGGHKTITKCRTCGESFWACPNKPQGNHVCRGPVIVEGNNWDKPQFVNCRNCGQRVRQDQLQNHRCPQPTQPQKPTVTTGNPLPPAKPTVGTGNPNTLKPADLDRRNIDAIRKSILDPLKDKQIEEIGKNIPSDKDIKNKLDKFNPPLSQQAKDDLMQAIRDGDSDKVKNILDNSGAGMTGEDYSTLVGIAEARDLIHKYNKDGTVKPSDIKKTLDTLKNADQTLLGNLSTHVQTLGKLNKISKILDLASVVIGGGSGGSNIPTGVVAIVTFPDLPYGVVFPLGNGVWGIGTGGKGIVGIWQGHIPQPPIYDGNGIGVDNQGNDLVIHNDTGEEIKYYVGGTVDTLGGHSWQTWNTPGGRIQVQLPSGRSGSWTTSSVSPGAYEFAKAQNGGWTLKEVKTEVTIKNTGNPIPFTFFIGGDKYVIEPGKDIQLNDPKGGNSVYEIQFARSSDTNDVARHAVGGKCNFVVGRSQEDGKWSLFWEGSAQVKPPAPQQNTSSASATLTYDDTPISSTNLGGLPVLPSYD